MKALSIYPEPVMEIFMGDKTIEYRSWQTDYPTASAGEKDGLAGTWGSAFWLEAVGYTYPLDEVNGFGEAAARSDAIPPPPREERTSSQRPGGRSFWLEAVGYTYPLDEVNGDGEAAARSDAIPPPPPSVPTLGTASELVINDRLALLYANPGPMPPSPP